ERNRAVLAAFLLVPRQSPPMCRQRRDNVVEAIAVHVVDGHDAAAGAGTTDVPPERLWMVFPRPRRRSIRRLLPPSIGIEDVDAAVAVDVPCSHAVRGR